MGDLRLLINDDYEPAGFIHDLAIGLESFVFPGQYSKGPLFVGDDYLCIAAWSGCVDSGSNTFKMEAHS